MARMIDGEELIIPKETSVPSTVELEIEEVDEETNDEQEEQEEEKPTVKREDFIDKPKNKKSEVETKKEEVKEEDDTEWDYKSVYDWLHEENMLEPLEDEYDFSKLTLKEIKNLVKNKYDKEAQAELAESLSKADEMTDGLLSYVLRGGAVEDFIKASTPTYSKMSEDDIKTDNKAEEIIRSYYKQKGVDDKRIEKSINRLKDADELIDEAKDILPELKGIEQERIKKREENLKKEREAEEKAKEKFKDDVLKVVDNTSEYIGVELTPKLKGKVKENIEKQTVTEKINKNWSKYLPTLAILDELGILDNKKDILEKVYKSAATKEVTKKITNVPFKARKRQAEENDSHLPFAALSKVIND